MRIGLMVCALVAAPMSAHAAIVWTTGASDVTFTKAALADPTLAANRDPVTPSVALTRGSSEGIFNFKNESSFQEGSPTGTEWAVANLNGNPNFTYGTGAAMRNSLNFTDWETAYGSQSNLKLNITAESAVLHVIAENVYLDIKFTQWGGSGGGSFTLQRAAGVIPEPASLGILAAGAGMLACRRRRR